MCKLIFMFVFNYLYRYYLYIYIYVYNIYLSLFNLCPMYFQYMLQYISQSLYIRTDQHVHTHTELIQIYCVEALRFEYFLLPSAGQQALGLLEPHLRQLAAAAESPCTSFNLWHCQLQFVRCAGLILGYKLGDWWQELVF